MEKIKELNLIDKEGHGFKICFYDTEEVEISYFQEHRCVDYVFVSLHTWETYFSEKSRRWF